MKKKTTSLTEEDIMRNNVIDFCVPILSRFETVMTNRGLLSCSKIEGITDYRVRLRFDGDNTIYPSLYETSIERAITDAINNLFMMGMSFEVINNSDSDLESVEIADEKMAAVVKNDSLPQKKRVFFK